jgi:hypothetical protein
MFIFTTLLSVCILTHCPSIVHGYLFIDSNGTQTLEAVRGQPVVLPNSTKIDSINILHELKDLRKTVAVLENELLLKRGCAWQGIYCHCYLENTTEHAAVLLGSFCNNSVLQWSKILDMSFATLIFNCRGVVQSSQCDGFFD